ncbi:hypothetical protein WNY37_07330 [Henriciella sp. AS95]|uniref:hypothetical protein n=1 Tax=Henriciella sp. AS95 TaxID=3135782 RepID=UPI00316FEDB4
MKKLVFAVSAAALAGCATNYRVPVEEAPPQWRDDGTKLQLSPVDGSVEAFGGTMKRGDVLLQFEVENLRTGVIQDAVTWTSPFGLEQTLDAGTPVYARQFTMTMQRTYNYIPTGPRTNLNSINNPIEWCAPREDDAVCIFWEGPEKARYIDSGGGVPQSVSLTSPSGMNGPVPTIIEQDVEFGNPLQVRMVITRLNEKEIRLMSRLYDGDDWTSFGGGTRRIKWEDKANVINLFGGKFEIDPVKEDDGDIKEVVVTVVEAPENVTLMTMNELLDALVAMQAAREAASEDSADEDASSGGDEASGEAGEEQPTDE